MPVAQPTITQYAFGIGGLWAVMPGTPPLPIRFGTCKSIMVELKAKVETLYGQARIAAAIGVASTDIDITIEQAEIDANRFNALYWGAPLVSGAITAAIDEQQTVPAAGGPYTITVANASNFVADLGVLDQNTGALLTPVGSAPAGDQYTVTAGGVYTFPAASASRKLFISYDYSNINIGANFKPVNPLMGTAPTFELRASMPFRGTTFDMTFPNVVMTSQTLDFKNENFMVPKMMAKAFAAPNGQFMNISATNAKTGARQ
jgi:hypothetical protein